MKAILKITTCLVLTMLAVQPASAQLLKKLQKKAADAVERKAEQKIDQKIEEMADKVVDSSFDAVFGGFEGGATPFKLGADVTTEDSYRFTMVTTMQIETLKGGKSEGKMDMLMYFNPDAQYTGSSFQSEEMKNTNADVFIVYDFKNEAMVMLMSSEGSKFSMGYDWSEALKVAEENAEQEEVDWDGLEEWNGYKKIGTKTIAGYSCEGYMNETDEGSVEIWVTRDAFNGMENMFAANANAKQMKGKLPADYPYGMMMEMTSTNKKSGEQVVMKVTDVNQRANVTYSMADYPLMSLGAQKGN